MSMVDVHLEILLFVLNTVSDLEYGVASVPWWIILHTTVKYKNPTLDVIKAHDNTSKIG